ncbi:MAG: hypothetical protein M3680_17115 [Myxococcota bacterium]|nr:hypothetical protein [Myxococcota bacterium]
MLKLPIPAALFVGLAVGVLADLVRLVLGLASMSGTRWHVFTLGAPVAEYLLVSLGLLELARRCTGRAHTLLRVAATLTLVTLIWVVAYPFINAVVGRNETVFAIFRWSHVALGALATAVAICVAAAARGFTRAPVAAWMAVLAVLARGWVPYVTDGLHEWLWQHRMIELLYWSTIGTLGAAGLLGLAATLVRDGVGPAQDPDEASAGFRQAAGALRFRIVAALALAVFTVAMLRSQGAAKIVMFGGPLIVLATMVICAVGFLRASRSWVDGLPRFRLAVGAAITMWWVGVHLHQLGALYSGLDGGIWGATQELLSSWSVLGPLLATAGLALVGSAISTFAAARANDELREAASVRTVLTVILFASSVGIQSQLFKASTVNGFVVLSFVAAGAGIAALVSFLGLLTRAADAMHASPTLPAARVVA